jgi:hypothetical protein
MPVSIPRALPSPERLEEVLRYDNKKRALVWRKSFGRARAGSVAGHQNSKGWRRITLDGVPYSAYQLLVLMVGEEEAKQAR